MAFISHSILHSSKQTTRFTRPYSFGLCPVKSVNTARSWRPRSKVRGTTELETTMRIGKELVGKNALWTQHQFDEWVAMRVGTDPSKPVYWYAIGDVFSAPRGTRELIIEGVDTAHVEVVSRTKVRQFSRKVFVFRDIETNEVVSQHQGKPLNRIAYDYQYITYSLENGSLVAETTMGTGDSVVTLRGDRFYWRNLKDSFAISSPLFTERGWIENYDFYGGNGMYHMAWCGSGPSTIVDTGHVMMEMSSVRMDSFNELPDSMKQYILEHAPKWQFPPKDLSEVTQIQKGESHTEGF